MKKTLSIILSVLMVFSAFSAMPFNALAAKAPETIINWVASEQGYENNQVLLSESINFDSNISASVETAIGNSSPKYSSNDGTLRLYPNNTFTVSAASGYVITNIVFTLVGTDVQQMLDVDKGEYNYGAGKGVWTGIADEIKFSVPDIFSSSQARIQAIKISYSDKTVTGSAADLKTGDKFQMGMYPQTKVTDDATITALGAIDCTMTGYGYMANSDAETHAYNPVDMSYADIAYNGEVYRKVTINQYRPYYTGGSSSNQSNNGYTTGNTYYFKWEPIVWQVLAKESDGVYVMSKTLLDSQAYNNYKEDTTWENCSLRTWLNDDFYAAAFSEDEQAKIVSVTHSNDDSPYINVSGGNPTTDNLWVLSYSDAKNDAYGFSTDASVSDDARKAHGTDYAKSQGILVYSNGNSDWWLRSRGQHADIACYVNYLCATSFSTNVNDTNLGIRPAFKLDLNATISTSDSAACRIAGHDWGDDGYCTVCGEKKPITSISSVDDLKEFAQTVNGGYDYSGETVTLEKDIVCSSVTDWTPIGNKEKPFNGTFDGKDNAIIGLSTPKDNNKNYVGLFGVAGEDSTIKNVGMKGGALYGGLYVGAIAGESDGTVKDCYNTGEVHGNAYVGGIVGYTAGAKIEGCYNTGNISGADNSVGGIIGQATDSPTSSTVIRYCYNTGDISGASIFVGGIVGVFGAKFNADNSVKYCYNTGEVFAKSHSVGGIVGCFTNNACPRMTVENCYNTGKISSDDTSEIGGSAGGIAGHIYNGRGNSYINNCYNTGAVDAKIAGGIVGTSGQSSGSLTQINNCYSAGAVTGETVGGVAGDIPDAEITNCYYDTAFCSDITAVVGMEDTDTVKGLTTAQMTGATAFSNMKGLSDSVWLVSDDKTDDEAYYWFYPHLKGFEYDSSRAYSDWPAKIVIYTEWKNDGPYEYDGREYKPELVSVIMYNFERGVPEEFLDGNVEYYDCQDDSGEPINPPTAPGYYKVVYTLGDKTLRRYFTIYEPGWSNESYKYQKPDDKLWYDCNECVEVGNYRTVLAFRKYGDKKLLKDFNIFMPIYEYMVTLSSNSSVYNGTDLFPSVTVNDGGTTLEKDTDYTVSYENSDGTTATEMKNPGSYKVVVNGSGNYSGSIEKMFEIKPKPVTVTVKEQTCTYNGSAQGENNATYTSNFDSKVTVSGLLTGDALTSIKLNGQETNAGEYAGKIVASAAAIGDNTNNYAITYVAGKLTIQPKAVTITAGSREFTYDGTEHSCSLYDVDGLVGSDAISAVVEGSITFPTQGPVANTVTDYQFTTGNKDNYTVSKVPGSLTMKWAESPLTITAASHTWAYDGAAHKDEAVTAAVGGLFNGDILVATATGSVTNVADTATGNNPIAAGYKVMHGDVDVSDNYVITANAGTLTITAKSLTSDGISVESIADVEYNSSAQKPAVTVKDGDKTLLRNTDYTVSYSNNINATTNGAKVTISGMGNYKDSVDVYFTIKKAPISPTVTLEGWTYGETANTPEVKGNSGNADVSFQYKSDNTDYTEEQPVLPGNYTVLATVAESPNYLGGEATAEFRIAYPEGWYEENGNKYYCSGDEILTDWQEIEGEWYYLGDDGAVQTGWQEVPYKNSTRVYYFDENGVAAQGWKKIDGDWYYFNICARQTGWRHIDDNWYYFDEDGKMQTGWLKDGGNWYYLKSSGAMATGWTKVDGKWYYMDCRLSYLGIMQTGWQRIDGDWYYMNKSGVMQTGWLRDAGNWYYLDAHGKMLKSVTRKIDGKSYTFDAHGVCTNP